MSVVFDRATSFYDQTRGVPKVIEAWLAESMPHEIGLPSGSRLLEVGVGTGRIALPLMRAGYHYLGVDLSRSMMNVLREKALTLPIMLVQADAAELPFGDATCDAVIAVHVFHLIGHWSRAMDEVRRVLRPSGMLMHGASRYDKDAPIQQLRSFMLSSVPGARTSEMLGYENIDEQLEQRFGAPQIYTSPPWTTIQTPRKVIEQFEARIWSATWSLTDEALAQATAAGREWALERWGDLDAPLTTEQCFIWKQYLPRGV